MSVNDDVKIVWKTKCKWRGHKDLAKRKGIRPKVISVKSDFAKHPLQTGDPVKILFGKKWYDGETHEKWTFETDKGSQSII